MTVTPMPRTIHTCSQHCMVFDSGLQSLPRAGLTPTGALFVTTRDYTNVSGTAYPRVIHMHTSCTPMHRMILTSCILSHADPGVVGVCTESLGCFVRENGSGVIV